MKYMKYLILNSDIAICSVRYLKVYIKINAKGKSDVIVRIYEHDVDGLSSHTGFTRGRVRRYFFHVRDLKITSFN